MPSVSGPDQGIMLTTDQSSKSGRLQIKSGEADVVVSIALKRKGLIGSIMNLFTKIKAGGEKGFVQVKLGDGEGGTVKVNRASLKKHLGSEFVDHVGKEVVNVSGITGEIAGKMEAITQFIFLHRGEIGREGVKIFGYQKALKVNKEMQDDGSLNPVSVAGRIYDLFGKNVLDKSRQADRQALMSDLEYMGIKVWKGKGNKVNLCGIKALGKGSFKQVYLAFSLSKFKPKALGQMDFLNTQERDKEIANELKWGKILGSHKLFLTFKKVTGKDDLDEDAIGLIAPYADGGTLLGKIEGLSGEDAANYTRDLFEGLQHLQKRGLLHKDLKLENFLIKDMQLMFSDYGLMESCKDGDGEIEVNGTPGYVAPELGRKPRPTKKEWKTNFPKVDNFSAGMVLLEMATQGTFRCPRNVDRKKSPLFTEPQLRQLQEKLQGMNDNPLACVIAGLIEFDPENRLSLTEVQQMLGGQDLEVLFLKFRSRITGISWDVKLES